MSSSINMQGHAWRRNGAALDNNGRADYSIWDRAQP